MRARSTGVLVAVAVSLAAAPAQAGNFDSFFQSDDAAMSGGAVTAMTSGTGAIWHNPAGLGGNRRTRLNLSASIFTLRLSDVPDGMGADLPDAGAASTDLSSTRLLIVPAALAAAFEISDGVSLGVGLYVSELESLSLQGDLEATTAAGTELRARGRFDSALQRYHLGPSVGVAVSDRVRLGVSLFGVYEVVDERTEVTVEALRAADPARQTVSATRRDAPTRLGLELVAGLQWEPTDRIHLALAVRSPRIRVATIEDEDSFASENARIDLPPLPGHGAGLAAPPRFVAALGYELDDAWVAVEGDYSPPLDRAGATAVWNLRVGAVKRITEKLRIGGGLFTDRSAVELDRFPEMRVHYYGASFGLALVDPIWLRRDEERATHLIFSTTLGARYALGVGEALTVRYDLAGADPDLRLAVAGGDRADVLFHELTLYIGTGLYF